MKLSIATKIIAVNALCMLASPAFSHVTLEYQVANASSYYKATFKVGHGCGSSPIRQIIVNIPPGVQGAKPMPKAGWAIDVARDKLAQPVTANGNTVTEDVSRITWTAKTKDDYLPANFYDEFVLQGKLPAAAGPLYWAVSQVCEDGRTDWVETPKAGQKLSDLKSPAALLDVLPAAGGGHSH